jgi:hypothetical protein
MCFRATVVQDGNPLSPDIVDESRLRVIKLLLKIFLQKRKCALYLHSLFGGLAQPVQSICLTSRGSAVRIRQPPPKNKKSECSRIHSFYFSHSRTHSRSFFFPLPHSHSHFLFLTPTLTLTLFFPSPALTLTLSFSHSRTHSRSFFFPLPHSHSHFLFLTPALSRRFI